MANALAIVNTQFAMPAIFATASPKTRKRVLEFFGPDNQRSSSTPQVSHTPTMT